MYFLGGCSQKPYQPTDVHEGFLGHFFCKTLFWIADAQRNKFNCSVWCVFFADVVGRKTFALHVLEESMPMAFLNYLHHK